MLSEKSQWTQNTMFVDFDWLLNASSPLSASAELLVTPKQVFGPHTAKSQPIWIIFCTHLLLYGIHLLTVIDRDQRVGGSRPNQNDYVFFFAILVTHPKSYGDDGSPRFRRQTVRVEVRTMQQVNGKGQFGVSELCNPWTDWLKIGHTWLRRWADLVCQIS